MGSTTSWPARTSDGALLVFAGNDLGALVLASPVAGTATWASWTTWAR